MKDENKFKLVVEEHLLKNMVPQKLKIRIDDLFKYDKQIKRNKVLFFKKLEEEAFAEGRVFQVSKLLVLLKKIRMVKILTERRARKILKLVKRVLSGSTLVPIMVPVRVKRDCRRLKEEETFWCFKCKGNHFIRDCDKLLMRKRRST